MKRGFHQAMFWLALTALAAGCGGGGGSSSAPPAPVAALPLTGNLDPAFGGAGEFRLRSPPSDFRVLIALQTDEAGNIYVAGTSTGGDFAILKLDPAGQPDPTFGADGRVYVDVDNGSTDSVTGMVIEPGGKLYVAGTTRHGTGTARFAVVKLEANGSLASDFGVMGRAFIAETGHSLFSNALLRDAQGNLYVTGTKVPSTGRPAFAVAKLTAAGAPVASFGVGGLRTIAFEKERLDFYAGPAVRDSQGNLYIAAIGYPDAFSGFTPFQKVITIAKLDADGHLVASYAAGGQLEMPPSCGGVAALAVGRNDDLYVATNPTCGKYATIDSIVKLDRDGRLVTSFGNAGTAQNVLGQVSGEAGDAVSALAVAADGSIFAAGNAVDPGACPVLKVAKLDENGRLVPAFGVNGVFRNQYRGYKDRVQAMVLDRQGRLYVGANSEGACDASPASSEFIVVRLK
ncbi:MAG TPA: hypothetical protein VFK48_04105 [Usitatibacter sp.]|nr:hypothetical protein [Usitatibacter sp.]